MTEDRKADVLIAYDGSDFAKAAIREAGERLAGGRRAVLLTVFEPFDKIPFFGVVGAPVETKAVDELFDTARSAAEKLADEGCELAREAGFEAEPAVVVGAPVWNQIVEVADERDAGLIVIGSRGLSGLKHVALGSVAAARSLSTASGPC